MLHHLQTFHVYKNKYNFRCVLFPLSTVVKMYPGFLAKHQNNSICALKGQTECTTCMITWCIYFNIQCVFSLNILNAHTHIQKNESL